MSCPKLSPFIVQGVVLIKAGWFAWIKDEYTTDGTIGIDHDSLECQLFDEGCFPELEKRGNRWQRWFEEIETGRASDEGFHDEGKAIANEIRKILPTQIDVYFEDHKDNRIKI